MNDRRETLQLFHRGRQYFDARQWPVAHKLLGECLAREPGNLVFADAFVQNAQQLRQHVRPPSRWRRAWLRRAQRYARGGSRRALRGLLVWPDCGAAWRVLVAVAGQADSPESERRLLDHACRVAPDDIAVLSRAVEVYARFSELDKAIEIADRLHHLQPRAGWQARLQSLRQLWEQASSGGAPISAEEVQQWGAERLHEEAQQALQGEAWERAAALAQFLQQRFPGDWRWLEIHEDAEIGIWRERAARAARHAGAEDAAEQAARLAEHAGAIELDVLRQRTARYPERRGLQWRLALLLKGVGRTAEAADILEALVNPPDPAERDPHPAEVQLELGECRQRQHQFDEAAGHYRAIWSADWPMGLAPHGEVLRRARYRGGVLAAANGDVETALRLFECLEAESPGFRDTRERLDKLIQIRHKG